MTKRLFAVVLLLLAGISLSAKGNRTISGTVVEADGGPVPGAVVNLDGGAVWAVTDENGKFIFTGIQDGKYTMVTNCLGYVDNTCTLDVKDDIEGLVITLQLNNLAIKEVVVTAQKAKDGLNTSHTLGRDALNHIQLSNMSDVSSLLPGGKTVNPDLTASNVLNLRAGGSNQGNAAFGTAVEVDGVRFGGNAGLSGMSGSDTRSISVDNIESVEVITGVPSAEYGDLNSGMVKINTKRGRTPLSVGFSVNPRTYQTSVSKGLDLGNDRGVLNVSGEWARATKKLVSPYESYTRRGFSATYSNTFHRILRFEAGFTGNIGGMNSKDDPDAYSGEYSKVRDNVLRANTKMSWLLQKDWITSLDLDASVNFQDNLSRVHSFNNYASSKPAVHATSEGYSMATRLPLSWFDDAITDSKELAFNVSTKYKWTRRFGNKKNTLKAGLQWKADGNVGKGEYYLDEELAADGFRDRDYRDYPFMHNISAWGEDNIYLPIGKTTLELTAGLRLENIYVEGSKYTNTNTLSPRFNAKWSFGPNFSIRAGWGITEKLPSFYILYPQQQYWDKQTFSFSSSGQSTYVYYTKPYEIIHNENLKWQRNQNTELGADANIAGVKLSLVGFYNKTENPYTLQNIYTPFSYNILSKPAGYTIGDNPQIKVDHQTGEVYLRSGNEDFWTAMDTKVTDKTFVKNTMQGNGADMHRAGAELVADFPEIRPLRTSVRVDANYAWTRWHDETLTSWYRGGSHTSISNRSYQYVGVYANSTTGSVVNGKITHNLDANVTTITHIPEARLIITCKLEMALLNRSRNISTYEDRDYAEETENGYWVIWPVSYMNVENGEVKPFTEDMKSNPEFSSLAVTSSNIYTFMQDGYGFYCSANLNITKEIGDHVSLSFFANNFTNSRPYVKSMATGVGAIFTPAFYYGLTCRLKF